MQARSGALQSNKTQLIGVAADPPESLDRFRRDLAPDALFLSDPELKCHEALSVPISKKHPMAFRYPKGGFLQPAVFIYSREGERKFEWRIKPKLWNLFGAARRISPDEVMAELAKHSKA